jgi:aminomethyltransferase
VTEAQTENKKSPLHEAHLVLGARIVPFAGWEMPVQYAGILEEHQAVREKAGVFDISHMGQFLVTGAAAEEALNGLLTNNIAALSPGQAHYTLLLNENGGVIDDLIAYRLSDDRFFLIVNASMIDEDSAWMAPRLAAAGAGFENLSDQCAAIAIQGPDASAVFAKMMPDAELPPRNGVATFSTPAGTVYVCRTGYTGEDGFELVCPVADGIAWWQRALDAGATPCGLGARDSLRLEMGYPLNGSDLSPSRTPLEAGLGFFVDLKKEPFIGRDVLVAQKKDGLPSKLCALRMIDKGPPPRPHYPVLADGNPIGELSSGGLSPSLGAGIGLAYVPVAFSAIDTALQIAIRGKNFAAVVVKRPFYRKGASASASASA